MIHSDIRDYGLDPRQWRALRKQLGADTGDAMVVVWGLEQDAATAAREVLIRAQDALAGVPAETRQAFRDGTNGFERILPGADRMYPDTDTPPLPISSSLVDEIRASSRETPWEREQRYEALGLPFPAARQLAAASWSDLYDALDPQGSATARRLAGSLAKRIPYHLRSGSVATLPDPVRLEPLVRAVEAGEIRPEAMDRILDELITRTDTPTDDLLDRYRGRPGDEAELSVGLEEVVQRAASLPGRSVDTLVRWGMGTLMRRFLGRLDPNQVRDRLELELSVVAQGSAT